MIDILAEDLARARARPEQHLLRAEAHGAALVGGLVARLHAARLVLPLGDQRDHRMRRRAVELGAVGVGEAEHVAAEFDDRHLHPQADAEVGHAVLAGVAHCLDLALDAALAEAARHQDGIHALAGMGAVLLDVRGLDVVDVDAGAGLQPAVHQRLVQRQVGVADLHVLADHRDVDLAVGIGLGAHHLAPFGQVGRRHFEPQLVDDDVIEPLLVQQDRDLVDVVGVDRRR